MNGAPLNRRMLNGTALGAVFAVTASIGFSAAATVTTAVPTHQQAGWVSASAQVASQFTPLLNHGAVGDWASATSLGGAPISIYNGTIDWTGELEFQGVVLSLVYANLNFEGIGELEAVPFEKFGTIPFTATGSWSAEGERVHGPLATWVGSASWSMQEGLANRGVTADWSSTDLGTNFEPTLFDSSEGTIYQAAFIPMVSNLDWEEDPTKVQLFVGDAVWQEQISVEMVPTLINALVMDVNNSASLGMVPWRTTGTSLTFSAVSTDLLANASELFFAEPAEWANLSTVNIAGIVIHNGQWQHVATTNLAPLSPWQEMKANADFSNFSDWIVQPTLQMNLFEQWFANTNGFFVDNNKVRISYTREAEGTWSGSAAVSVDDTLLRLTIQYQGEGTWAVTSSSPDWVAGRVVFSTADWNGLGSQLAIAAVLKTFLEGQFVYAPDRRTLIVAVDNRGLIVPEDRRAFDVLKRTNTFSI